MSHAITTHWRAKTLPRRLRVLLEEYGAAREESYWMNDQGSGGAVGRAQTRFLDAEETLLKYLNRKRA